MGKVNNVEAQNIVDKIVRDIVNGDCSAKAIIMNNKILKIYKESISFSKCYKPKKREPMYISGVRVFGSKDIKKYLII